MHGATGQNSAAVNMSQDVFRKAQQLLADIRELRVGVLPHLRLVMLRERAAELRKALRAGAKAAYRQKRRAQAEHDEQLAATAEKALSALAGFFSLLRSLAHRTDQALFIAERRLGHKRFHADLAACQREIRVLLSTFTGSASGDEMERNAARLPDIISTVRQLKVERDKLSGTLRAVCASSCKIFDSIFGALENSEYLAPAHAEVAIALRGVARQAIAASYVFDRDFYLGQLPDAAAVSDCFTHYLSENPEGAYAPNQFFNDRHYLACHPEVRQLRYAALEHFARYGEALRYDPCPEFDTRFYLESNDDVLDAGVSPFEHFLSHGLIEERPPSGRAGTFFNSRYLAAPAGCKGGCKAGCEGGRKGKLVFVGEPEKPKDKNAWEILRGACEARADAEVFRVDALPAGAMPGEADGYVVCGQSLREAAGDFFRALGQSGAVLVYFGSAPREDLADLLAAGRAPVTKVCAFTNDYESFIRWQEGEQPLTLHYYPFDDAALAASVAGALLNMIVADGAFPVRKFVQAPPDAPGAAPVISVVSIIYKKAREMCAFLESLNRQDIAREYEVILVNDASPDDAVRVVEAWLEEKQRAGLLNRFMRVTLLHNASNLGNCLSRNKGIEAARADIVLVADGDVAFGASCLTEHCRAYRFGDCDAVVGFFHFDVHDDFVFTWATACALNPHIVRRKTRTYFREHLPCYPMDGLYNFVTRNISFKKSSLHGDYFDPDFSYSSAPDSGYGHEDHELSARLYCAGRRRRFAAGAIAVHIRHRDNSCNADKNLGDLRNWNRLFAKHPDLPLVDRQYYQWKTVDFLYKTRSHPDARERIEARARYADPARVNIVIPKSRPRNILLCGWHAAYYHELCKLNHHFTLVTGGDTANDMANNMANNMARRDRWDYGRRPLPDTVRFKPPHEIDADEYDFAILSFAAQAIGSQQETPDGGATLRAMLALTRGMPRAAVCRGMPPECDASGRAWRDPLKDVHVVCASHQAQNAWRFHKSSVIRHGFSPHEFPPGRHGKACLTLPEQVLEKQRGAKDCADHAVELLKGVCEVEYSSPPLPHPGYEQDAREWAVAKFQNYTRYIGEFAVYLDPFVHSPMPEARAEAMMTGVIPVSLRDQDADMYIQNGVNGFYGDSAEELAGHVAWLAKHAGRREAISRNARLTALDVLNSDRFLAAWSTLFSELAG